MRSGWLCGFTFFTVISLCLCGCGTPERNCTFTTSVTPVTATLDHTKAGNSQTYTANVTVPSGCPELPLPPPVWSVSNITAATITQSGVASCKAAASAAITVSAGTVYGTAILICD